MKTHLKWIPGILAIGLVAALVAACGGSSSSSSSSAAADTGAASSSGGSEKPANVAFLNYLMTDFVQSELDGIKTSVEASGGSVESFTSNYDPQKQLQQCNDAITSGRFNAIVLDAVDPASQIPCVKAAKAAGIPVVAIEIPVGADINTADPQVDGIVGAVPITAAGNAKGMVDQTVAACEGIDPCKVIVEIAMPGDPFTTEVEKQLKAKGGNIDVVDVIVGQYDPATIQKSFADALSAHADANVFLSASDSNALAVIDQIKAAGLEGKLKVLGNGGSHRGAEAVANGTLVSTLGNWPIKMGETAGQMAVDAVNGRAISPAGVDALTLGTPFVLTKDTVSQFKPEWGAK